MNEPELEEESQLGGEEVIAAEVERGRPSGRGEARWRDEDQETALGSELQSKERRHRRGGEEKGTAGKDDSLDEFGPREEL